MESGKWKVSAKSETALRLLQSRFLWPTTVLHAALVLQCDPEIGSHGNCTNGHASSLWPSPGSAGHCRRPKKLKRPRRSFAVRRTPCGPTIERRAKGGLAPSSKPSWEQCGKKLTSASTGWSTSRKWKKCKVEKWKVSEEVKPYDPRRLKSSAKQQFSRGIGCAERPEVGSPRLARTHSSVRFGYCQVLPDSTGDKRSAGGRVAASPCGERRPIQLSGGPQRAVSRRVRSQVGNGVGGS